MRPLPLVLSLCTYRTSLDLLEFLSHPHLCSEIPQPSPSAGQTNLIPIPSPHTAQAPADPGAVLEPLQRVSISHTMGCVCLKTAQSIADAASPQPGRRE